MEYFKITTPDFSDNTKVITFYSHDAIHQCSCCCIIIHSRATYDYFHSYLGYGITCKLQTPNYQRIFYGYLTGLTELKSYDNYNHFKLILTTGLGLLRYHKDFGIYKHTDIKSIMQTILCRHPQLASLECSHIIPIKYTIQYGETDYDFIRRLCLDYNILILDQAKAIRTITESELQSQTPTHLDSRPLKTANHQLWNYKNGNCYSNYPDLEVGHHINHGNIITTIKHYIDNTRHYYYQYLSFDQHITLQKLPQPRIIGLQKALTKQKSQALCEWDHQNQLTHTIEGIGFQPSLDSQILIKYQNQNPTQPYVYGAIYSSKNQAPFCVTHKMQHHGYQSQYNDIIRFQFDRSPGMCVSSPQSILFQSTNSIQWTTGSSSKFAIHQNASFAGKSLQIQSSRMITLQCASSRIILTPNKITLHADKLLFFKPGIET